MAVSLAGCGKSGNSPQPVSPAPQSPPPAPPIVHQAPPAQSPPRPAATVVKAIESQPKMSALEQALAAADPRNVFEIVASGTEFEVGSAEERAAVDRETIDSPPDLGSSEEFVAGNPPGRQNAVALALPPSRFKLPAGFVAVSDYGYAEGGLPRRIRCEKTGNLMVLVPEGPTRIGSPDGPAETQPEFRPLVLTFYMDETEVTLEQYNVYRDDVKGKKNLRVQMPVNDGDDPRAPALGLPWGIVQTFVSWAGKELPTEVEFEKAARGAEGFRTPWGNGRAVFGKTRTAETLTNVGMFPADQSVYGIFDLAGNAREWCADYYSDHAHVEASAAVGRRVQEWLGPKRASVSGQRVVKGNGEDWAAWHRQGRAQSERHADVGFRCVLRIKSAEAAAASSSRN